MPDILKLLVDVRVFLITLILGLFAYYMIAFAHSKLGNSLPFMITKRGLAKLIAGVLVLAAVYKILSNGGMVITMIIILFASAVLAYIMNPIVNKLEKKKIKRPLAILIVYLGIIALIAVMIMTIGPKIVEEITEFGQKLPSYAAYIYRMTMDFYDRHLDQINKMANALDVESPENMISSTLSTVKNSLSDWIVSFATGLSGFFGKVFNLVLIPIITFYMLKDKDKFKDFAIKRLPWRRRDEIIGIFREIDEVIGNFIRGQLIVCAFIGVATSIALAIIGIEFSIMIGIFAGIFNIVPYLGPIIGLVPAAIMALIDDPIKIVWVVIAITVIQQFESNFITPKIVGDSVGLHPLVVMTAVILGGAYFGLIGMLFAVPAVAVARIMYRFIRDKIKGMDDDQIFEEENQCCIEEKAE